MYTYIKNYFFINLLTVEKEENPKAANKTFEDGVEENCSLDFDEYRDIYLTRCRWS